MISSNHTLYILFSLAKLIHEQIAQGKYNEATSTWNQLESVIDTNSNSVDFYNFLLDSSMDPLSVTASESMAVAALSSVKRSLRGYSRYLSSKAASSDGSLEDLMNGVIKQKLKIIPQNVRYELMCQVMFAADSSYDLLKWLVLAAGAGNPALSSVTWQANS
ncbi:Serine carboxypeptidase-like 51 [Apostasia shenzhenica]|uniref:Serine carboxypeptidase-like 51 n=1 Tax=Apostasia shenzhenica TaxID=1088818 RepID=A0A2I0AV13_9ASPA|nr:Serine carboxypeptidase-like 51 [Apostasia shenzhenica]